MPSPLTRFEALPIPATLVKSAANKRHAGIAVLPQCRSSLNQTFIAGDCPMRLLFGMILGAALTIGFAYVHDQMYAPLPPTPPPAASEPRPIVNWDVVNTLAHRLSAAARLQWERLTAR
jgi:hypothetical protein